jgi:hypothetical protein
MKKQNQLFVQLIELAGGRKKFLELTKVPAPRLSEWLSEKHQVSLIRFLELCSLCDVDIKKLF